MQSLDRGSQLFENSIADKLFARNYGIIVFDLSGTQGLSIVSTGTVRLRFTYTEPLTESIELISLNQFEIFLEITLDGSVLLVLNTMNTNQITNIFNMDLYMSKYKTYNILGFPGKYS